MENKTNSVLLQETENNSPSVNLKKIIKRNLHRWHRTLGIITVIPVIFWTLSGLMHPFMSHWFKPKIAHEFIVPQPLDKNNIKLSLQKVLAQNGINEFKNFRLVTFNEITYYQVKTVEDNLLYFNAADGVELLDGDRIYAEYLARFFIDDQKSQVNEMIIQAEFSQEYKYVNRLLPVWKISFDRPDQMDVYVETSSSRLGTFNTVSRKVFLQVFDVFHNWSFLNAITMDWVRIMVMISLLSVIIFSAISGIVIYGLMWKRFKKPNSNHSRSILIRYHRQIGISVALVTLTFAFSGAYHATRKLNPNRLPEMVYEPVLKTEQIQTSSLDLNPDWERMVNLSVIRMGKKNYFQVFYMKTEEKSAEIQYLNTQNAEVLKNANFLYAQYLANKFANILADRESTTTDCCEPGMDNANQSLAEATLLKTEVLHKFESREYGFVFKRLPVVQLAYDTPGKDSYYIETSTSKLAAAINNADRMEGYSFAIFHKYLFLDWAGKDIRDLSMMFSALGVLVVSLFGLAVFLKK